MSWAELRKSMDNALKQNFIPSLRELGFKGSIPHFKRKRGKLVEIFAFQFSLYGPQFYIEVAACPETGTTISENKFIPADKVKYYQSPFRTRIGLPVFDFENNSPEVVAKSLLQFLEPAQAWWNQVQQKNP